MIEIHDIRPGYEQFAVRYVAGQLNQTLATLRDIGAQYITHSLRSDVAWGWLPHGYKHQMVELAFKAAYELREARK